MKKIITTAILSLVIIFCKAQKVDSTQLMAIKIEYTKVLNNLTDKVTYKDFQTINDAFNFVLSELSKPDLKETAKKAEVETNKNKKQ